MGAEAGCAVVIVVLAAIAAGLVLLALAPDRFVAGSAGLARHLGVSPVVVGAVIIGFGTSAPEMLVSGLAALDGEPAVGIGNVVGSNLANLGLIVSVAALIAPIQVHAGLLRRELPLTAAATVLFALLVQDGLERWEGAVLLVALPVAVLVILRGGAAAADHPDAGEVELAEEVEEFIAEEVGPSVARMALATVVGLLGTLAGAQLLVWGAVDIAGRLDLSGGFVGLTIVALGTSLPELVTAVAAARAGEDQLILGNVLGSNLFNALAVGGVVGLVGPAAIDDASLTVGAVLLMLAITAVAAVVLTRRHNVTRAEALVLLIAYLACLPLLS
ncbi:MAG TPA: calcium/sodium antiporter [Acidimicrobiales bacterium]